MPIVTYEQDGAVGIVTMAKPPHNLIDETFLDELLGAYRVAVSDGCRAILLRSGMRHFCAGADVGGFTGERRRRDQKDFEALIDAHQQGRLFGFIGERRVNVLTLNLALDRMSPHSPR